MGLFQRKRFVWYEPWFFQQRIRTKKAWILFSLMLLTLAIGVGAALLFAVPMANPLGLLEITGLSLGVAAAAWWALDGVNTRRQAVLLEDSIVVGGDMGKYSMQTTYKLSQIASAAIVMPEESKWPAPALFFLYDGEEQGIGIESKASVKRLAQALHDAGIPTRLDGWFPNQESEFSRAFSWQADAMRTIERARLETLPSGTPGVMTVGGILLAIVRQCWAIALALLVIAGSLYYGYANWKNLGVLEMGLMIAIPIGAMLVAGEFTERFACAATSQGLARMMKGQMRKRSGIQIDPDADDLIPVEIFQRDQFDKSIQKIHEMGYLRADVPGRRMLFEGKQQRWCLPARSIHAVTLEEVQMGTPGQSALGALHYYAVVRFAAEADQEFGFRYAGRDYGEWSDVKRAEGGVRVFEAFESVVREVSGE